MKEKPDKIHKTKTEQKLFVDNKFFGSENKNVEDF